MRNVLGNGKQRPNDLRRKSQNGFTCAVEAFPAAGDVLVQCY